MEKPMNRLCDSCLVPLCFLPLSLIIYLFPASDEERVDQFFLKPALLLDHTAFFFFWVAKFRSRRRAVTWRIFRYQLWANGPRVWNAMFGNVSLPLLDVFFLPRCQRRLWAVNPSEIPDTYVIPLWVHDMTYLSSLTYVLWNLNCFIFTFSHFHSYMRSF